MEQTHSTAEVAETIGAPSERWLVEQIRSGRFPARKVGRSWRMTDSDVVAALNACRSDRLRVEVIPFATGLTPRSRKRVVGQ
jgi:hypothetical protein